MINKKELKRQYKQTTRPMGVYEIRNLSNNKIFLGSSRDLPGKINSEKFQLENRMHINRALQDDFSRLGGSGFSFTVLDTLEPVDEPGYDYTDDLNTLLSVWIEKLSPFGDRGYNLPGQK